ncbi:MAG: HlyD family secretion protein [Proteobacteria bacterium]|nr:HlyD family secretion protein [Pseudomonadota bacterium]
MSQSDPAARPSKRRRIPLNLIVFFLALLAIVLFGYRELHDRVLFLQVDDARIRAEMVTVSSRTAGWLTGLAVREGQPVDAGSVLVTLDARDAALVLAELTAQRDAITADRGRLRAEQELERRRIDSRLHSVQAELASARVTVSSLEPQLKLARQDQARNRRLFERGVVSRSHLDQSEGQGQRIEREFHIATANLRGAASRVQEAETERARLAVLAGQFAVLDRREAELEVRLQRQRLDIADRTIHSPTQGVIDRKFVEVGEYVAPGQRLFMIHDPARIWIEANVKETDIQRLAVGQSVHLRVDAYPDEAFSGAIERIGHAATSTFALLPSPNPSGNFTKITQRIPVRIAIEQREGRLRPGMMVEVRIATGG